MKLLLVTPLYPPEVGGTATYAKILEEGLPAHDIEVELVKFKDVRHLPKLIRHFIFFLKIFRKAIATNLILVQDTISCGIPAICVAKILFKPIIVRVPGDYAWEQGRQRWGIKEDLDAFQSARVPWQVQFLRTLQSLVVRSANKVLVPSYYFASVVEKWGVEKPKIQVIYHGISLHMETISPKDLTQGNLIVTAGRLVPWKGFEFLIRLLRALPSWHLVIIGDGPDYSSLKKVAYSVGVADRVTFTGNLSRTEMLGWIVRATAFVLATSWESFSFQIVEAMALGAAIITTAVGSIPELITDGLEGKLLAPFDYAGFQSAIESTLSDPIIWMERKKAAKQKAQKFSQDKMLQITAEFLKEI